jgi:hypothetical protein
MVERFPGIPELEDLFAVQQRLQNVKAVVQVGGPAEAQRLARLANRRLAAEPAAGELSMRDLQLVRDSGDGLRYVQFYRSGREQRDGAALLVSVVETPHAPPGVSVMRVPAREP